MAFQAEEHSLLTKDGTRLAAYRAGRPTAPAMVLANGLGGNIGTWRHLIDYFAPNFRFLSWDYRGLFHSGPPADPARLAMADHCSDLECLLESESLQTTILVGWSMGVQVALEYYRHHPDQCTALILINGTAGRPIDTAFRSPHFNRLFPHLLDLMRNYAGKVMPAVPLLVRSGGIIRLLKGSGLVSKTLDESVFNDLAQEFAKLDFGSYCEILRHLGAHDARDVLTTIKVPTLIIAGEHDLFTPRETAENMQRQIPGAQLFLVPAGTHYTPVEYPELVNLRIEKFLREHGLLPEVPTLPPQ